jgi:thymidylate synthase (FAD)
MTELEHVRIKAGGHKVPESTEKIMEENKVILDKGYVRLVNTFGTELDIVNAARVSFAKESTEWSKKDQSLLDFLLRAGHMSPLRHVSMTFECYVPLIVARQHWKYVVGSTMTSDQQGWNESSRRYVTEDVEFYFPEDWRKAPKNLKQGSGEDLSKQDSVFWNKLLLDYSNLGRELYDYSLSEGIAPELARLFLPAYGLYVRYRWTASLSGILHFLDQRLDHEAQYEMQQVAIAVNEFVSESFPNVMSSYHDR